MPKAKTPRQDDIAQWMSALPPLLQGLARRGSVRLFRKGVLLIQEGDRGDALYVLLQGRVRVFATGDERRELVYGVYGAGEYFGEMSLDGGPRSASVMAVDDCWCAVVGSDSVREHLAAEPAFAFALVTKVIERARTATQAARELALLSVYERLAALLERSARPADAGEGSPRVLPDRLTHAEMAARIGASREMVSRILGDLEAGGHIRVEGRRIHLLSARLPARW